MRSMRTSRAGLVRTIDLPRSLVFYSVFAAFVLMLVRAIQVAVGNWRRGYSVLERPGAFDNIGE